MKLSNKRKAFYITVSILLAFLLWFYVDNSEGVVVDVPINGVPVEFLNADSSLASKGLMLIGGDDATVDLVLTMPRNIVYGFDADRVRAIADLRSVNSTGAQSLSYSIAYPENVDSRQITIKSPTVRNVSVRVGSLFRRDDVEIRYNLVGTVAEGYVAGRVQLLPETLEIWGQQSDVMQVSYAQVTLNIENARSTIVELLEYELYGYNDELIENSDIRAASDTVQVTMPVISATDVPLVVRFIELPGVRIDSFDWSLDQTAVTLSGDASLIAQLGEIELGEVALAEITDEAVISYDIEIPDGLTNLSGVTTATLTIRNRDIVTLDADVTRFEYENFGEEDRTVEIVTSSLGVTLRGPRSVIEGITPEMITAVADLSGVTDASGTYTVPAEIRVEGDADVGTIMNYQLTVRIGLPETETDEETEGEADGEAQDGDEPTQEEDQP